MGRDGTKFFFMGWDGTKSLWDGSSRSRPGSMPGPGWDKVLVGWELPSRSHGQPIEYQVISFDLTNILIIFQVYINHALHDLVDDFCIVYLDDILVFSKSKKKHYQHLQLIIKHL